MEYGFRCKNYNCVFHIVKCWKNRVISTKEKVSGDQCFQLGGGDLEKIGSSILGLWVILNKHKSPHNFVKKIDFRHWVALSARYRDSWDYGKSSITPLFR